MQAQFGELLTYYRTRAGISQAKLARMVRVDHSFISRLERGARGPSRETVLAIARALDLADQERDELLLAARYAPGEE
jgi:transcriptional regulator with XRE-family HTH domain